LFSAARKAECADGNNDAVFRGENPVDTPLLGICWNAETATTIKIINTDTTLIEHISCRFIIVICLGFV
jgi:hypothetical protein